MKKERLVSSQKRTRLPARGSYGTTTANRLRVEQALNNLVYLNEPAQERLVGFPLRLYPSQIYELEQAATRLARITPSELARELIEIGLDRWR